MQEDYKLLDDIWYYDPKFGWVNSFVIGHVAKRGEAMLLVAKHGPPVELFRVLPEKEFHYYTRSNQLGKVTQDVTNKMKGEGV